MNLSPDASRAAKALDRIRGHVLLPASVLAAIPGRTEDDEAGDMVAELKLFCPYSDAVWFIAEVDTDGIAFGWAEVHPGCGEYGYTQLSELLLAHKNGLPLIERDLHWSHMPMKEAIAEYSSRYGTEAAS